MEKKEKLYLLAIGILISTSITFVTLYLTKKPQSVYEQSTFTVKNLLSTEPAPDGRKYIDYFQTHKNISSTGKIFDYRAFWVKKSDIASLFSDANVNGFYMYPIQYDQAYTSPRGRTFNANQCNVLLSFTRDSVGIADRLHYNVEIENALYDYNDPCLNPPHCP